MDEKLDCVIIGLGPAGITAGIYAACYRMRVAIIGNVVGGEMQKATRIINYPGQEPISGADLTQKMIAQLDALGHHVLQEMVTKIGVRDDGFTVIGNTGHVYQTHTVLVATGTERRKLRIPGETEFTGKGVFYCATCDANQYDGKTVSVVGGSNAAVQAAVLLSERAQRVYIIYRGAQLRADPIWIQTLATNTKIEILYKTNITKIAGTSWVTSVELDEPYNGSKTLSTEGVFIEIGGIPGTSLLIPLGVVLDEKGFIETNTSMETNVGGLYAAGDCTVTGNLLQQISVAVGEGAKAMGFIFKKQKQIRPPALWGKLWTQL